MKSIYVIAPLLLLGACSKTEEPLVGKREPIIVSNLDLEFSGNAGKLVLQPSAGNPFVGTFAFAETPKEIWKYKFYDLNLNGNIMAASPVLVNGKVFVLDAGGIVHCLDAKSGKLLWKAYTTVIGETGQSGGAIAYWTNNNTLLVSTSFGELFFINATTGKTEARMKLPSPCKGDGILVEGNTAYLACIANDICAINLNSRKIAWSKKEIERDDGYIGMSRPASYGSTIIIPLTTGELVSLDKSTGKEIWKILLSNFSVTDAATAVAHVRTNPIISGNTVYVNSPSGMLYAINAASGDVIWSRTIGSLTPVNITGDHLFVANENAEVACLNKHNGRVLSLNKITVPPKKEWRVLKWLFSEGKTSVGTMSQFLTDKGILHITPKGDIIHSEYNNGRAMSTVVTDHPVSIRPVMVNNEMYVLSDDGFVIKYGTGGCK